MRPLSTRTPPRRTRRVGARAARGAHATTSSRRSFRCLHPELARIARPGATFAAFTYGLCRVGGSVDEVVDRLYRGVLGPHWPPERAHVDAAYRTLPFPWPELAAPSLSIEESWTLDRFVGYLGTWSAVTAYRCQIGDDPLSPVIAELRAAWGRSEDRRRVTWVLTVRAGRLSARDGRGDRP